MAEVSTVSDPLLLSSTDVSGVADDINRRYPFGGSMAQLLHFDWLGGVSSVLRLRPNFCAGRGE